jgi:WD40 repeat protein
MNTQDLLKLIFRVRRQTRGKVMLRRWPTRVKVTAVMMLGSHTMAASGASGPDIVWSTNAARAPILALTYSADGALLAGGSMDSTTRVWRLSDRALVQSFSTEGWASAVAIAQDRSLLGVADDVGTFSLWRLTDGSRLWFGQGSENSASFSAAFSPDSQLFCRGKKSGIGLMDIPALIAAPFSDPERGVYEVCFSPDGTLLASGNDDNTASLFRIPEGTLLRDLTGHSGPVTSVDFSPDGKLLATASADGTARMWHVPEGTEVRKIPGGGGNVTHFIGWTGESLCRIRFSSDGKSLLTVSNGTLRFWSAADGRFLLAYTNLGTVAIAVAPDGKHFAYGTGSISETNAALVLAHWPLLITGASLRTNTFQLEWQGGDSGVYQVEHRTELDTAPWEVIAGPITNTNLSVPASNRSGFYRVRNLSGSRFHLDP